MKRFFRWIPREVYPATLNMAIDETLMRAFERTREPILRFYSWSRPAITAGYFQDILGLAEKFGRRHQAAQVVRRLTGGGMVVHGKDLTFSLTMDVSDPLIGRDVKTSYLKINEALMAGLGELVAELDYADCRTAAPSGRGGGERICFEKPSCYDVMKRGEKVVGASQRRKDGVLLHQSAVFLEQEAQKLESLILKGFEKKWGIEFRKEPLSLATLSEAQETERSRYSSSEWAVRIS